MDMESFRAFPGERAESPVQFGLIPLRLREPQWVFDGTGKVNLSNESGIEGF